MKKLVEIQFIKRREECYYITNFKKNPKFRNAYFDAMSGELIPFANDRDIISVKIDDTYMPFISATSPNVVTIFITLNNKKYKDLAVVREKVFRELRRPDRGMFQANGNFISILNVLQNMYLFYLRK